MPSLLPGVGHKHQGHAVGLHVADASEALVLKLGITYREDLVGQEAPWFDVDGHREPQAHAHSRRVVLHGDVDEVVQAGKVHDVVESTAGLLVAESEQAGVQEDVLGAGQFMVEPHPQLDERGYPAAAFDAARGRLQDAADQLQQGALARAVMTEEGE
ncbi:hypothetical protein FQZ97_949560 [compost metagenome]